MTIEERLLHEYGSTDIPEFATWMLKDGTMVNGSYEGHQRDEDHRCVTQFFKRSKFEDLGSAYLYLEKFMKRGNIRMSCSESGYCIELYKIPTDKQFKRLDAIMLNAASAGIETLVIHYSVRGIRYRHSWEEYLDWLSRYSFKVRIIS